MTPDNCVIKPIEKNSDKKETVHRVHHDSAPHASMIVHDVHPINNYSIKPNYISSSSKKNKSSRTNNIFKKVSGDAAFENIKTISKNFAKITGKKATEKDVLDIYEILYSPQGSTLDINNKEKIIVNTISAVQNRESGKKINSINYFKMPIFENFKKYKHLKVDNKLF